MSSPPAGAATGNIEVGERGADAAAAVSSILGMATLAVTKGETGAGATAAEIEGVGLTPFGAGLGVNPSIPDLMDTGHIAYKLLNRGKGGKQASDMTKGKCSQRCP